MQVKPLQINAWEKLGQTRAFYGIGVSEVLKIHPNMFVLAADLSGYSGLERFSRLHPDKVINVGIQEQNMIGVATGVALEGNLVYAGTYAAFSVPRAMEQVRHNLSILNTNIKLVGFCAGYTMESLGRSHWATEDISLTRCLPNMTVVAPADCLETVKVCLAVAEFDGPAYIRLCGNGNCPKVYHEDYVFKLGRGIVLKEGTDTVIIAHGRMVHEGLLAAEQLEQKGVSTAVVNMHTIKPLDEELLARLCNRYQHVFVVEEHNIIGGLGSAVAEFLAENPTGARLHRLGMRDCLYELGSERFIWDQAGITDDKIVLTIEKTLNSNIG